MIDHVVLTLLRDRPDCGYRLRQRIERRMGSVWGLNPGQVYVALRRLAKRELITSTSDPEVGGNPGRRRWAITLRGQQALEGWARQPLALPRFQRDEMLVRLLLLLPTQATAARAQVDALLALCERQREALEEERADTHRMRARDALRDLSLLETIFHLEAQARWLEACRRALTDSAVRAS